MKKTKRTFIAVKVPVDDNIEYLVSYLKESLSDEKIRWIKPENLHITLRFIGETDWEKIGEISEQLDELVSDHNIFELGLKDLGVFRSVTYPRVLWAGLDNVEPLKRIKLDLDQRLKSILDQDEDKRFSPHLTLGRMKKIEIRKRLANLISEFSGKEITSFSIDKLIYFESVLRSDGAVYEPVSIHSLS